MGNGILRAIVTGGASGIGRATVEKLLAEGAQVVSFDLTHSHWEAEGLHSFQVDLSQEEAVVDVFAEAARVLGGNIDALVHCAGIYQHNNLRDLTIQEWNQTIAVNCTSAFVLAKEAAQVMDKGSIVLLTSVAYARGDELEPSAPYAASKGAIVSLTRQLAVELGAQGIRVNAVAPGVIDTPITTITQNPEATDALTLRLPARRLGEAREVASACLFLAGAQASYITGAVLPVDGGYLVS